MLETRLRMAELHGFAAQKPCRQSVRNDDAQYDDTHGADE
jgi:hypothetical protein